MLADLSTPKFEWDHPTMRQAASAAIEKQVSKRGRHLHAEFAEPADDLQPLCTCV